MICPVCKAGYRDGFARCADCDVELVRELPVEALVAAEVPRSAEHGDLEEDPFCSFWKGEDPRVHAELCELLSQHDVPFRTVRRQDHLFNINTRSALEIGIPFSLFEKAEAIVKEAYGDVTGAGGEEGDLPAELPESIERRESRGDWDPENWYPEEATVEIWAGEQAELAELLAASVGENRIHARVAEMGTKLRLLVMPGDENRAKEIVRQVVEAAAPE